MSDENERAGPSGHDRSAASGIAARLRSSAAWVFAGRVLGVLLSLLINAWLARLLSPADMGGYLFAFSLLSILVAFAQFGLPQTAVRRLAEAGVSQDKGSLSDYVRPILLLGVGIATVVAMAQFLAARMFDKPDGVLVANAAVLSVWLVAMALGGVLAEIFRGLHAVREATLFGGLTASLILVLLLAGASMSGWELGLADAVLLSCAAAMASLVISGLCLLRWMPQVFRRAGVGLRALRETALQSVPAGLIGVVLIFMSMGQMDVLMLGIFAGADDVAVYGAAARLVMLVSVSLLMVNAVVAPLIPELNTRGRRADLERLLRRTAAIAAIPAIGALAGMVVCGGAVLAIVYGDYYARGAVVLVILSLGQLVNVLAGSCNLVLVMTGNQNLSLRINLSCLVIATTALVEPARIS